MRLPNIFSNPLRPVLYLQCPVLQASQTKAMRLPNIFDCPLQPVSTAIVHSCWPPTLTTCPRSGGPLRAKNVDITCCHHQHHWARQQRDGVAVAVIKTFRPQKNILTWGYQTFLAALYNPSYTSSVRSCWPHKQNILTWGYQTFLAALYGPSCGYTSIIIWPGSDIAKMKEGT